MTGAVSYRGPEASYDGGVIYDTWRRHTTAVSYDGPRGVI